MTINWFKPLLFCLSLFFSLVSLAQTPTRVLLKTNMGDIVLEMQTEAAPKTVENFLKYVKAGFYSGTVFHRVIDNFMIQGGGYDKNLKDRPTRKPVPSEARNALDHGLKNEVGTVAMARTDAPNSATSQFFINVRDNEFLNHQILPEGDVVEYRFHGELKTAPRAQALRQTAGYTPFAKVVEGMEVVEKIKQVETGDMGMMKNVPLKPIIIESAKIIN